MSNTHYSGTCDDCHKDAEFLIKMFSDVMVCSACFKKRDTNIRTMFLPKRQPIETAPKDGTWILLFGGEIDESWDSEPPAVAGQYAKNPNTAREGWHFAWYDGGYYGEYLSPTHWMPLPTPEGGE